MSLFITEEVKVPFDFDYKGIAEQVINFCLDYVEFPYEADVELTLTNNEEIHQINMEYRQIDRPTDVLSFPMYEYDTPEDFSFLEEENDMDFNPETGNAILGDIIISVDKVLEQAESYGHSPLREYAFLITHSMLHLFGHDHETEEERVIMEEKQNQILDTLNIRR